MIPDIVFRPGTPDDIPEMQQLFSDTILSVGRRDYTEAQCKAWASGIRNKKRWKDIPATSYISIAVYRKKIVGFCTLQNNNHIDLLFVHRDFQRMGIARVLYGLTENEARKNQASEITANVSKTARPFFEQQGFRVVSAQTVELHGIELRNFRMKKPL